MVSIRNIGEALLSHIEYNDKTPVKNIMDLIQKHKISLEESATINMYKKELYKTKYENPRNENQMKYDIYLKERNELVNKWKQDINSRAKLLDILNFKRPELEEVEDIYSYQNIDLNADKKVTLVIEKNKIKDVLPVKTTKSSNVKEVKSKECPPGKILNPVTNRCITDKTKKIVVKEIKPVEEVKIEAKKLEKSDEIKDVLPVKTTKSSNVKEVKSKECPPGKILNPVTNRCITDKTKKTISKPDKPIEVKQNEPKEAKEIKSKECPPGKILNPVTNRCIKNPKK